MSPFENVERGESLLETRQTQYKGLKSLAVIGLVVLAPLAANFMIASWVLSMINAIPGDKFFQFTDYRLVNQFLKGGLVMIVGGILIVTTGKLFSTKKGSQLENRIDMFFLKIPLISTVYTITKTAADTVFTKKEDFKHPVKIPFGGIKFTGFRTGHSTEDGDVVFIPTSPNITSGFVLEIDEERLERTDEDLEGALKRILSAGFSK